MFEDVRHALHDLLHGNVPSTDRRALLTEMRGTLVRARMGLDDLRDGLATAQTRLAEERAELDTVRRRKALAEGINDLQTVEIAVRFEATHAERVALLEKKVEVAQGELALVEREVEEMTAQFKAASAGVGSGIPAAGDVTDLEERDAPLDRAFDALDRERRRAATEAEAEERLAELKRRMGR